MEGAGLREYGSGNERVGMQGSRVTINNVTWLEGGSGEEVEGGTSEEEDIVEGSEGEGKGKGRSRKEST